MILTDMVNVLDVISGEKTHGVLANASVFVFSGGGNRDNLL
jgi:hypothetical protein